MRLVCPNCGAQYEVDASVIPDDGRDVQCSNCGHTWFQRHAHEEAEAEEDQPAASETVADEPEEQASPADVEAVADTDTDPDEPSEPEHSEPDATAVQRQALDEGVANILREESERETAQRDAGGETALQADTGSQPDPEPVQQHAADIQDSTTASAPDSTRSDILPDIEEINSTLAAAPAAIAGDEDEVQAEITRRGGFKRGFSYAILVFAFLALIYMLAPKIATTIPATAGLLSTYVDWVNSLRLALDGMMMGVVDKLTGLLSEIDSNKTV